MEGIYLDNAATTPLNEKVLEVMMPFLTHGFGNPSSPNTHGWFAKGAIKKARKQVAEALNCDESEIIFNSGSTEGINTAIKGVYNLYQSKGNHIVTTKFEHKAVLDTCAYLEKKGAKVTYLSCDEKGKIDLADLEKSITPQTILVAIMHGNNETGVVQDVETIGNLVHEKGSLFLSDCSQTIGKRSIDVQSLPIDILPISAHKIHGPKGVGALYLRRKKPRVVIESLLHGGGQEKGLRAGTLNVAGIVGLGSALELFPKDYEEKIKTMSYFLKEFFESKGAFINGFNKDNLKNIINIQLPGVVASSLMKQTAELSFSLGSACNTDLLEPSHVLTSMGLDTNQVKSSFRISLGYQNTMDEMQKVKAIFEKALNNKKG